MSKRYSTNLLKVVKLGFVLIGTAILMTIVIQGFQRYQRGESKAIVEANMPSENMPILAFTVCPAYQYAYKDKQLNRYSINKEDFRRHFNFTSPVEGQPIRSIFEDITYRFQELVERVRIRLRKLDDGWVDFNLTGQSDDGLYSGAEFVS